MRIFLDANVLFSASHPASAMNRLVAVALREGTVVTSDLACAEARKNLAVKRPAWLEPFESLQQGLEVVASSVFALPVALAPKDVPLLCAAIRARCRYFVTGDRRDFGHLFDQVVDGVEVITPLRLAQIMAAER